VNRRADIALTEDERAEFLAASRTLSLATVGVDGWPHLSAMWYVVRAGDVWFTSYAKAQKVVNLRRDPRVTVMVEAGEAYTELRGLTIEGHADVHDDPELAAAVMQEVACKYQGLPAAAEIPHSVRAMARKRAAVQVVPARVASWDHAKLGGRY
jgi:PPOX class probable F420-dependent enzyme